MIYFARGVVSGLWKVGFSSNVRERASTLSSTTREPIEVVAVIRGNHSDEQSFHRALVGSRAIDAGRGREWYRVDGAVRRVVDGLPDSARGSYVVACKPRVTPRRASTVPRAAVRAERRKQFVAKHGHEQWQIDGCEKCRARRARYARLVASKSPLIYRERPPTPAFLGGVA